MTNQLTDRQQNVYDMIRKLIVKRGYGPTVREIGEHFGIKSPNGVMCHLRALERKGLIKRSPNKSRAIELMHAADRSGNALPVAGIVSDRPHPLDPDPQQRVDFSEVLFGDDRFVLQVSGDALIDAHITDGDYVVVQRQDSAEPGQLVVAKTANDQVVLHYWHPEGETIRLDPANRSLPPLRVQQASVLGVAVGVVRNGL